MTTYVVNGASGGGGGSGLPTATGAGQVPVADGAGTAYTATDLTAGQVFDGPNAQTRAVGDIWAVNAAGTWSRLALGEIGDVLTPLPSDPYHIVPQWSRAPIANMVGAITADNQPFVLFTPVFMLVELTALVDWPLGGFTYNGGALTLTSGANGAITALDAGIAVGTRIAFAFTDPAAATSSGIYVVTDLGSDDPGGSPAVLTRAADMNASGDVVAGLSFLAGDASAWRLYQIIGNGPWTLDTTAIYFRQVLTVPTTRTVAGAALSADISAATIASAIGLGAVTATGADAAAARAAVSAEIAVDLLPIASALHHWRLGDAASPFADSGSSAVTLAYVAGSREYGRAGLYARYGATRQRSPTGLPVTDRAEAVISDVASGVDLTVGVTVCCDDGTAATPSGGARIIAALHDGGGATRSGILILTNSSGQLYINVAAASGGTDLANVTVDWSRPHRIDVTRVHSTGAVVMYVDGISRATATVSGTMDALTRASIGSVAQAATLSTGVSELLMTDFTVHTSVLSASTLLSRADACRRLAAG